MGNDLFIEETGYISASRAAEKLGYAQDHIGALIRKGKVQGKKIGRAWFVDFNSLTAHKESIKGKTKGYQVFIPRVESVTTPIEVPAKNDFFRYALIGLMTILLVLSTASVARNKINISQNRANALTSAISGEAYALWSKIFKPHSQDQVQGLVVLPNNGDNHLAVVSRIKAAFSDEVKVNLDEDGTSGVITPIFHPGDDTEDYTFVMVPIQAK